MKSEFILTLLQLSGYGRVRTKTIIDNIPNKVETIQDLFENIQGLKKQLPQLKVPHYEDIEKANFQALKIIEDSTNNNIQITSYLDSNYSKNLLLTSDYPLIIYSKGNLELLDSNPKVAVIGTRNPSDVGLKLGTRITEILVEHNFIIVSGLALGCDTIAHKTCLDKKGRTIAVMAGGLNDIYPKNNLQLSNEIIESNGLLISEYPIGTNPRNNFFVERNRIQSGISNGVCVIETDITGGTIRTVEFAEKQDRVIGCVNFNDSSLSSNYGRGNRTLIAEKRALPLSNPEEVTRFIQSLIK